MHFANIFSAVAATMLATSFSAVKGCAIQGNATSNEQLQLGDDGPADEATVGYNINHFALNVYDKEAAMHFYGKILGMRHIFTYDVSPALEFIYLGYSVGGKNGTGFQTAEELYRQKDNTAGLVELLHRKDCNSSVPKEKLTVSTIVPNTFGHVGLIVPDVAATQERMKEFNVKILKEVGVQPSPRGPVANTFGIADVTDAEGEEIVAGLESIRFDYALLVEDPDGNLVEIIQQT